MLHLEEYKPEHFWLVDGREGKPTDEHRAIPGFYYDTSFFLDRTGRMSRSAFTAFDDDLVLGCAGVVMLEGKGEVWMHISEQLADFPLWLTQTAIRKLIDVIRACPAKFLECFIPIGNTVNREWIIRALGFKDMGAEIVRGELCRHYMREVN